MKKNTRRIIGWSLGGLAALLVIAVVGFVIWASFPMRADADRTAEVDADPAISVTNDPEAILLEPTGASNGQGLVFVPGARVEAAAYEWTLQPLVDAGYTVVITHPALNFAILEIRGLETYTALAPEVDDWAVGGHSLGGVRACQYAADEADAVDALILFGSYCSADLSGADLEVLSIGGGEDGLSTPAKIADAAALLPADATFTEIAGMNHAQFGAYGEQSGDGEATIPAGEAREAMTAELLAFLS